MSEHATTTRLSPGLYTVKNAEGEEVFGFCLRDDTAEIRVLPNGAWHRIERDTGTFDLMERRTGERRGGDRRWPESRERLGGRPDRRTTDRRKNDD